MPTDADEKLKIKEQWLREEIRADRTLMTSVLQWGVAVLAAVQLNLYGIRHDAAAHMVTAGVLRAGEILPLFRWVIGTLFLTMLAAIFSGYMTRAAHRHRNNRKQLVAMSPNYSGIKEDIPAGGSIHYWHYALFFLFPAFDLFMWCWFYVGEITIHVPW
jgi:hypothetical protein